MNRIKRGYCEDSEITKTIEKRKCTGCGEIVGKGGYVINDKIFHTENCYKTFSKEGRKDGAESL